jgi:hypothetical protein
MAFNAPQACFGEDAITAVHAEPISCAGVTMGPWESMLMYLEILNALIDGTASRQLRAWGACSSRRVCRRGLRLPLPW